MTDSDDTRTVQGALWQIEESLRMDAVAQELATLQRRQYISDMPLYLRRLAEELREVRYLYNRRHGL